MANNISTLQSIVSEMETQWTSFKCDEARQTTNNGFHFGWSSEVNEIHNKTLPLMIVNPPTSSMDTGDLTRNYGIQTSSFTLQIYQYAPSKAYGQPSKYITTLWDDLESCFYVWLENLLNTLGSNVCWLASPTLSITRTKDAANDALFMIQVNLNLQYYRTCLTLN
jgi:hypothetical protein